jgi:hypothetical protein
MKSVLKMIVVYAMLTGALSAGELDTGSNALVAALRNAQLQPDQKPTLNALVAKIDQAKALGVPEQYLYALALGSRFNRDRLIYDKSLAKLKQDFPDSPYNKAVTDAKYSEECPLCEASGKLTRDCTNTQCAAGQIIRESLGGRTNIRTCNTCEGAGNLTSACPQCRGSAKSAVLHHLRADYTGTLLDLMEKIFTDAGDSVRAGKVAKLKALNDKMNAVYADREKLTLELNRDKIALARVAQQIKNPTDYTVEEKALTVKCTACRGYGRVSDRNNRNNTRNNPYRRSTTTTNGTVRKNGGSGELITIGDDESINGGQVPRLPSRYTPDSKGNLRCPVCTGKKVYELPPRPVAEKVKLDVNALKKEQSALIRASKERQFHGREMGSSISELRTKILTIYKGLSPGASSATESTVPDANKF